jgi:hypothetical protein
MAIVENLKVNVDVDDGAKSLKQLKAEFKETQTALEGLDASSKEYTATLKKLANTKDEIEDLNDAIKSQMGAGKFEAFSKVGSSIASGFAAATGAAALFGSKSEEVEQALLRVQAAMAFADGLRGLEGLGDAFKNAKTVAVDFGRSAVDALKGMKAGIAATGIGLLVVAVGALVAYWDDVKKFFESFSKGQEETKALNETLGEFRKGAEDATVAVDKVKISFDLARKGVVDKRDALKLYNDTLGDSLGKTDDLAVAEKNMLLKADAYIKIQGMKAQANILLAKAAEAAVKGTTAELEDQTTFLDKFLDLNPFEVLTNGFNKIQQDQKKRVAETKVSAAEESAIYTKLATDITTEAEKISNAVGILSPAEAAAADAAAAAAAKRAAEAKEKAAIEAEKKRLQAIADTNMHAVGKEDAILKLQSDGRLQDAQETSDAIIAMKIVEVDTIIEKTKEEIAREKSERRAAVLAATNLALESTKQLNDGLQSMSDIYFTNKLSGVKKGSKEEEAILRKQFDVNKKLQISMATITGIQNGITAYGAGVTAAVAGGVTAAAAPIWGAAYAAISAVGSMAAIAKIKATQFGSSASTSADSGGGNIGSFSQSGMNNGVNNTSTNLNANGTVNTPPVKVYVTQTDIHSANNTVEKIKTKALIE